MSSKSKSKPIAKSPRTLKTHLLFEYMIYITLYHFPLLFFPKNIAESRNILSCRVGALLCVSPAGPFRPKFEVVNIHNTFNKFILPSLSSFVSTFRYFCLADT